MEWTGLPFVLMMLAFGAVLVYCILSGTPGTPQDRAHDESRAHGSGTRFPNGKDQK